MSIPAKAAQADSPYGDDDCSSLPDLVPVSDSSDDEDDVPRSRPAARSNAFSRFRRNWVDGPRFAYTAGPRPAATYTAVPRPAAAVPGPGPVADACASTPQALRLLNPNPTWTLAKTGPSRNPRAAIAASWGPVLDRARA